MRAAGRRFGPTMRRACARASGESVPISETIAGLLEEWIPQAAYITKDGSDRVSAWTGRYAGEIVSQGTAGMQSLWSATGFKSAYPSIYCDGGDILRGAAAIGAAIDGAAAHTVLYVIDRDSGGHIDGICGTSDGSTDVILYRVTPSGGDKDFVYRQVGASAESEVGTQDPGVGPAYGWFSFDGAYYNSEVNGTASLSGSANNKAPTCDSFDVGGGWYSGAINGGMLGHIAHILVYSGELSAPDLATLGGYLTGLYGL